MSEITDFYSSWLGTNLFGIAPSPNTKPIVKVFTPNDISDCYIWFNCDDQGAIELGETGEVVSMKNLGQAAGYALKDISNVTVTVGVNNLKCLDFQAGTGLTFTAALPYDSRTQFVVFKNTTDMSGAAYPYLTFLSGGAGSMQTGANYNALLNTFEYAMAANGVDYALLGSIPENPYNVAHSITYRYDSVTAANNMILYDNSQNILASSVLGLSFTQTSDSYIVNNAAGGIGQGQLLCEVIEYGRVLTDEEVYRVLAYLHTKWEVGVQPTPPVVIPSPLAEFDLNNYIALDSNISNSIFGGDPALINLPDSNTFVSDMSNSYLTIYAPDNYPNQTGGIFAPSLSNVTALEMWINYPVLETYGQYFVDARTGADASYWIWSNTGQTIGSFFENATVYVNTVGATVSTGTESPPLNSNVASNGWNQVVICPISTITDDIAFFTRYNGEQGMPISVADIALYDTPLTSNNVKFIFNSKCARYGLSPVV